MTIMLYIDYVLSFKSYFYIKFPVSGVIKMVGIFKEVIKFYSKM